MWHETNKQITICFGIRQTGVTIQEIWLSSCVSLVRILNLSEHFFLECVIGIIALYLSHLAVVSIQWIKPVKCLPIAWHIGSCSENKDLISNTIFGNWLHLIWKTVEGRLYKVICKILFQIIFQKESQILRSDFLKGFGWKMLLSPLLISWQTPELSCFARIPKEAIGQCLTDNFHHRDMCAGSPDDSEAFLTDFSDHLSASHRFDDN